MGLKKAVDICLDEQAELVDEAAEADLFGQVPVKSGPGRPKGSLNKETEKQAAAIRASGMSPLSFLTAVYRDEGRSLKERLAAAVACLPYVHKKQPQALQVSSEAMNVAIVMTGDTTSEAEASALFGPGITIDHLPEESEENQ